MAHEVSVLTSNSRSWHVLLWCLCVCSGNGSATRREGGEAEIYKKKLVEMFGI